MGDALSVRFIVSCFRLKRLSLEIVSTTVIARELCYALIKFLDVNRIKMFAIYLFVAFEMFVRN